MKTIWHWKEILKFIGVLLIVSTLVGITCSTFHIPASWQILIGSVAGYSTFAACHSRWDFWHYV